MKTTIDPFEFRKILINLTHLEAYKPNHETIFSFLIKKKKMPPNLFFDISAQDGG